ncbi:transmembrane protein 26 [Neodiprion virginianus]|uniref:transmembrane protein 26 n=1 Tax=Neodiprion virginianus TaxID=2961670 RepID=UPI001EE6F50B|nr:transmembrane protein 26 [Neodiprion virginianus]
MAKLLATLKAIITRLVFAAHGFVAIWQVTTFKKNPLYWYLSCPILLLFFEGIFTLTIKENQEWKWFCPSVFLYLSSVVPAIWLLELDKVDRRLKMRDSNINLTDNLNFTNLAGADLKNLEKALGMNIRLPDIQISTETWVTLIEQFLMLILIIGRWMLPKGELTRDQLSQLLLVYIGTAADIIEFFDSFKEGKIAQEPLLVYLTLAIWAWSLMQFTVVLTATKSRKSRLSSGTTVKRKRGVRAQETSCCSIDVWGIALNMALQDGPFLGFRLILIIHYQIVSYMNIFFTCKNTLVILLQLYRLYVVQSEGKIRRKEENLGKREAQSANISIISRSTPTSRKRKREEHGSRRPRRDQDSESDESARETDKYELSPRNLEAATRRTRGGRQDTGYSTSSSRTSSKQDKLQKRENKKKSTSSRRENSTDEERRGKRSEPKKKKRKRSVEHKDSFKVGAGVEKESPKGSRRGKVRCAEKKEKETDGNGRRRRREAPDPEEGEEEEEDEMRQRTVTETEDEDDEEEKSRHRSSSRSSAARSFGSDSEGARRYRRRRRGHEVRD